MPDDALWIEDGYTRSHRVEAVPGLHPAVEVSFRPAVERERKRYDAALATRDAEKVEAFEADLIARHVLAINGAPPSAWKDKLHRLHPTVRATVLNLVLSYTPARWAEAEGNSGGTSG